MTKSLFRPKVDLCQKFVFWDSTASSQFKNLIFPFFSGEVPHTNGSTHLRRESNSQANNSSSSSSRYPSRIQTVTRPSQPESSSRTQVIPSHEADHSYNNAGPSNERMRPRRMLSRHQRNADELDNVDDEESDPISQLQVNSRLRLRNNVSVNHQLNRRGRRPRLLEDENEEVEVEEEDERRSVVVKNNIVDDSDDDEDDQPLNRMLVSSSNNRQHNTRSGGVTKQRYYSDDDQVCLTIVCSFFSYL